MLVLSKTDPYKLTINREKDILDNGPIIPRCYEVTYLKFSKSISINIDKDENRSKNMYRGEGLCGRWCYENEKYILFFQINGVGKKKGYEKAKEKDKLIRKELPLMLNAIIKSEERFFGENEELNEAEIFIKFNSFYNDFYKVENWGTLKSYINIEADVEKTLKEKKTNSQLDKQQNKIKMQENLIINLIQPHIELFLFPMYGKGSRFLINDIKVLNIEEIEEIDDIRKDHELVVSVKLLEKNEIEEIMINVRVTPNSILVNHII